MRGALEEFRIGPIKTTIPLHRRIMNARPFIDAKYDIHYLERFVRSDGTGPSEIVAPR
jgi:acetyl-CoA carboxylase biotin carboxylase subunit